MKIRGQFLFPVVLTLSVACVAGYFLLNMVLQQLVAAQVARGEDLLERSMRLSAEAKIDEIYRTLESLGARALAQAAPFTSMPEVVAAYELAHSGNLDDENSPESQRAREQLRKVFAPVIAGYRAAGQGDFQLHFHLPNGRSLVRLWRQGWQANRNGVKVDVSDDISSFRKTVVQINQGDHRPISGIEIGRGGFVVRGLAPIAAPDGRHLGSNEFLLPLHSLLEDVRTAADQHFSLYMNSNLLTVATKMKDAAKFPVVGGEFVLAGATDAGLTDPLIQAELLRQGRQNPTFARSGSYFLAAFPVYDFSRQVAGVMVMVQDISDWQAKVAAIKAMGEETIGDLRWQIGVGVAIMLLGIAMVLFVVTRRVTRPLELTAEMIAELNEGHLDRRLNMKQQDEIGSMARAMDALAESLQVEVVGSLEKMARGDLDFSAVPHDSRDVLRSALNKVGDGLNDLVRQIQISGNQISSGAAQVSDSSQSLSQGATEQASSLEQISASINQMTAQIRHTSDNAGQADNLAGEARRAAAGGQAQMQEMVAAMGEINTAGHDISKIIKTIDEIAFQTNLLALNAAVEAARAGQHGKGFAVVAEEVRNLAARSAKAAAETSELIEQTVAKTDNGAQIAERTAQALDVIVAGIGKVSDLIGEINAATSEQNEGITQVNQGLGQIDQVTQQNTANAEESAAAAEELASQSAQLKQMLGRFRLKGGAGTRGEVKPTVLPRPPAAINEGETGWEKGSAAAFDGHTKFIALDDEEFGRY